MLSRVHASVMVTPLFVGFSQVGLLSTPRFAVVLAASVKAMPFFVVLVRATFMSVPRELEEAALVDGNSRIGAFFSIVLPLARNGILVCAILTFMTAFGEYIYSKSIIQDVTLQPASVGLSTFVGPNSRDWNAIMAYASIYVTPILALFVILQRRIVSGQYGPGQKLPSEHSLVEMFGASRITVGRAVRDLSREGLVERRAGSGTYVRGVASGGMSFDPGFLVETGGLRPHQVRLQGGDASSDSYCYA